MRSRMRSIRFKVFVLLLIPTISLVGLWTYAVSLTLTDVLEKRRYDTAATEYGELIQGLAGAVAAERQASVMVLSTGDVAPRRELYAGRGRTDGMVDRFRRISRENRSEGVNTRIADRRLDGLLRTLDGLGTTRQGVDAGSVDRLQALRSYNLMVDELWGFSEGLTVTTDVRLYRWADATILGAHATEIISRESTLVAGALATRGRLSVEERRVFVEMVTQQRQLWARQRSLMDPGAYARLERHFAGPVYADVKAMEDRLLDETGDLTSADATDWQNKVPPLIAALDTAHVESNTALAAHADDLRRELLLRLVLGGGLGLLAIVASIVISVRFGRRLSRELVDLRSSATELADVRLPAVVERLRRSEDVDVAAEAPEPRLGKINEVSAVARSFATVRRTAIEAAVGQAELRKGVNQIFLNIARRNQSLLHRQLFMLDALESRAEPDVLEDLFQLDHLTTRMRRHAEGLIILSGAAPGRGWRDPVRIVDVLRGAVAEVEDYARVAVLTTSQDAVIGTAVADVIHLIAELMENATSFSPPNTEVHVMADMVSNGLAVEIEDRGLGISPAVLDEINQKLADTPEFDLADTDQLGLFVVSRLAERHGIHVSLRRSPYGGTSAIVLLPHGICVSRNDLPTLPEPGGMAPAPRETRADVRLLRNVARTRRSDTAPERAPLEQAPIEQAPLQQAPPERAPFQQAAPEQAPPERAVPPARAAEQAPSDAGAPAATHAGLPRRIRQQNLAPQLRGKYPSQSAGDREAGGEGARSPEQTSAMLASMQAGWRRGRTEAKDKMRPVDGEGPK
ncbi:sensor histidine kinase [Actinomadura alba]|uniref:histidine kinase n=1 Tax=Actinomadura alba TaxID=406431 RepID=A0ABR7LYK8_9ACTN|nr:nitrate- and nitrite sensing domain-containing protein [Actinomadura alba]MBC6469841.1 nitrate- and nitrite sensing domain-containing protein [Actinomadura alba]